MNVLVLGAGAREHALVWRLAQDPEVGDLFCAPGSAGMQDIAQCDFVDPLDGRAVASYASDHGIDLVVVGPEAPLVAGLADVLHESGIQVFGPRASAARLEGSKSWAKGLMRRTGIPTAAAGVFDQFDEALAYADSNPLPFVVKADGLAAGKGVFVCEDRASAREALQECMQRNAFGAAGATVVIEECLVGEEVSLIALVDGKHVVAMEPAQDYKRLLDGDGGPNTGGMGSYSPVPAATPRLIDEVVDGVLEPAVAGLVREGVHYVGALYAGLMLTETGPKVLEFNCRFGDPETQALLPRLSSSLTAALAATCSGDLSGFKLAWKDSPCVAAVAASRGYPGSFDAGKVIEGLHDASQRPGVEVFHSGVARIGGRYETSGGRVLTVSALGVDFPDARARAYLAMESIRFDGMHYRRDIAQRAVEVPDH